MKCPKCGYLGFDDTERCRNCGYEFSLIQPSRVDQALELPLRQDEAVAISAEDLVLKDTGSGKPRQTPWQPPSDPGRGAAAAAAGPSRSDLPLFGQVGDDDTPLITTVSPPRPPLAVRRTTAEAPRVRAEPRRAPLFDTPGAGADGARSAGASAYLRQDQAERAAPRHEAQTAALGARLAAVFLDLTLLALIDGMVVYFTLQICGLGPEQFALLPKAPLAAFLLVQNGGYLVAFTLGGQTLGKIAAGIKVVSSDPAEPIDAGRAFIRTIVWFGLAVPAGLGFLTTVFGPDHRGLHDRWAGTRVVRAAS
jgi:uncharacterized RDD family membrane protein YckC